MLILSCDKYSDLCDSHVEQLNKNWKNRKFKTYIVTDKEQNRIWDNVKLLCAGENTEFTDRLKFALSRVETKYVFITLDDYFLIEKVDEKSIDNLIEVMNKKNIDYIRLFPDPRRATSDAIKGYERLNYISTEDIYSVNLYASIWTKDFMNSTISERKNPWQYEVSLYKIANKRGAICAVSNNEEFKILDVVRKGKILYGANKYMKRYGIVYNGNREVHSLLYEIHENIRAFILIHMPKKMYYSLRKWLIKMGMHSISNEQNM